MQQSRSTAIPRLTLIFSALFYGKVDIDYLRSQQWVYLKKLDTLASMFYKGDNCCEFLFAFLLTRPLLKRGYSKWKELLPRGANPFVLV